MRAKLSAVLLLLALAACDTMAGSWVEISSGRRAYQLPEASQANLRQHNSTCFKRANDAASDLGPRYTFCNPSAFVVDSSPTGQTSDWIRLYENCMRDHGYEFKLSRGTYRCQVSAGE